MSDIVVPKILICHIRKAKYETTLKASVKQQTFQDSKKDNVEYNQICSVN